MQTSCMDAMRHKVECGDRLRAAIEALGLTQKQIADELGTSTSKINHWVSGRHYPPPLFLAWIGNRHGVTSDWVYRAYLPGLPKNVADNLLAAKPAVLVALPAPVRRVRDKRKDT